MPGYDTLLRISQFFGVSLDYLLGNNSIESSFSLESKFFNDTNYYTLFSDCSKLSPTKRQALLAVVHALLEDK